MNATPACVEPAAKATLLELGNRVRAWRARRGMTRKALALDSGLSERFLADVESGKGNVSINSLEAAAQALNISLIERTHIHIAIIAVLHLQIANAAAHIPDNISLLPIFTQRKRELSIGFIHNMKRGVECAFKAALIKWQQTISPL